jgi:hypothetical protein
MRCHALPCVDDVDGRGYGGLPGLGPGGTDTSRFFTVDVEAGRRYPVFIVLVRY